MFENLKNAFKDKGIRKKIFITIALLLVYRICCYIPVPGLDAGVLGGQIGLDGEKNQFLGIMSAITGGALANGTILALGITPYINASIIMQLLTVGIPALERLSKDGGEEGRKKIAQITRYVTLGLALVQAIGILVSMNAVDASIFKFDGFELTWLTYVFVVVILTAGTAFTMWLGERITDHGVGNGISMLIFAGILASAGGALIAQVQNIFGMGVTPHLWVLLGFLLVVAVVFGFIVYVDLAERKIPVQYAKQIKGRKMYGGQSTVIPIRVNASGVLPLIFAFAILSFPQLIANMFWPNEGFARWWGIWLGAGSVYPFYSILLALLILGFAYFYAQIQFNPDEVSRQIQQYGGFIPGIRPGKPTTDYLKKISKRITLFGAIFLAIVALVPSVLFAALGNLSGNPMLMSAFSATGLLIIVSVALEFDKQLESQIVMKVQKGFLK